MEVLEVERLDFEGDGVGTHTYMTVCVCVCICIYIYVCIDRYIETDICTLDLYGVYMTPWTEVLAYS